jgi:hypothetical protein
MRDTMRIFIVKESDGYDGWDIGYFTNREAAEECKKFFDKLDPDEDHYIYEVEVEETFKPYEK